MCDAETCPHRVERRRALHESERDEAADTDQSAERHHEPRPATVHGATDGGRDEPGREQGEREGNGDLGFARVRALGHRLHGADWRGLEPPRHLQLFTANGLVRLLREAGFVDVAVRSSARGADENLAASNAIAEARRQGTRAARAVRPGMRDRLIDIVERAGVVAGVDWGEELVADARRAAR